MTENRLVKKFESQYATLSGEMITSLDQAKENTAEKSRIRSRLLTLGSWKPRNIDKLK